MKTKLILAAIFAASAMQLNAQWLTTGNAYSGTDYLGATLGTNTNPLRFKTGDGSVVRERMTIMNGSGKVGINTDPLLAAAPSRQLHVATSEQNGGIRVTQTSSGFSSIELQNNTGSGATAGHNYALASAGVANGYAGNFAIYDYTDGAYRLMIEKTSGNIGVGTEDPDHKFQIHNGALKLTGSVTGYGGPMVLFGSANANGSGNEKWGIEYTTAGGESGLNFWKPLVGNYYLFLHDNGNVGIGTNDPGSFKLAVEGKIGCRELKVTLASPWPDYVFDDNYTLKPLKEVEQYINENKHLPGIPSSDELIKNEGMEVGNMQTLQMEKVEELYLYMIEMNKRMEALETENQQLKTQLQSISK